MSTRTAYEVKSDEKRFVHVEFMKIRMVGKETERFYTIQKFWPREFDKMKKSFGIRLMYLYYLQLVKAAQILLWKR